MFLRNRFTAIKRVLNRQLSSLSISCSFSSNSPNSSKDDDPELMHIDEQFKRIPKEDRNKATFNAAIVLFQHNRMRTRGHVEFLNTALNYLKEYNLHKDLDTYKALLNVFPKGPLIPTNVFQKTTLYYPLQQHCCVRILDELEWNGVQPDKEVHDLVANAFGEWNFATRKIKRMLYWMPKLKHTNKYLDRRQVENKKLKDLELAKIALRMMCRDPGSSQTLIRTIDGSTDMETNTEMQSWIVSSQSPLQNQLISGLAPKTAVYVDGPRLVYVMENRVKYFTLTTQPADTDFDEFIEQRDIYDFKNLAGKLFDDRKDLASRNVHQQPHETILGMAVFQNHTDPMAVKWVNHLCQANPRLSEATIVFRIRRDEVHIPNAEATS